VDIDLSGSKSHNGCARFESNWGLIPTTLAVERRTLANNREDNSKSALRESLSRSSLAVSLPLTEAKLQSLMHEKTDDFEVRLPPSMKTTYTSPLTL
jgi:hypothetical protein